MFGKEAQRLIRMEVWFTLANYTDRALFAREWAAMERLEARLEK